MRRGRKRERGIHEDKQCVETCTCGRTSFTLSMRAQFEIQFLPVKISNMLTCIAGGDVYSGRGQIICVHVLLGLFAASCFRNRDACSLAIQLLPVKMFCMLAWLSRLFATHFTSSPPQTEPPAHPVTTMVNPKSPPFAPLLILSIQNPQPHPTARRTLETLGLTRTRVQGTSRCIYNMFL